MAGKRAILDLIKAAKKINLRDCLLLIGLGILGYGLYLFAPWISFTVCGILILVGGFFMERE